jgi:hypothetical protein
MNRVRRLSGDSAAATDLQTKKVFNCTDTLHDTNPARS